MDRWLLGPIDASVSVSSFPGPGAWDSRIMHTSHQLGRTSQPQLFNRLCRGLIENSLPRKMTSYSIQTTLCMEALSDHFCGSGRALANKQTSDVSPLG